MNIKIESLDFLSYFAISFRPRLNSRIITGKGQRTHSCLEHARYLRIWWHKSRKERRKRRDKLFSLISSRETFNRVRYAHGISIADRRINPPPLFSFFSSPSSMHDLSLDGNYGTVAILLRPVHKVECTITWPPLAGVLWGVHVPRCTVYLHLS